MFKVNTLYFSAEPGMGKTCSLALLALEWAKRTGNYCFIIARKRSCTKVMFLHLSVSHSVHSMNLGSGVGNMGVCIPACTWKEGCIPPCNWPGCV